LKKDNELKDKDHLKEAEYYEPFDQPAPKKEDKKKRELALERAWHNRDFEIDKYWSRATYFWAFIAATFAGYIAVMASDKMSRTFQNELGFIIICMGLVFSVSWYLVNIGSKKWQENWEKHIDMLEDYVTGPIYKTVWNETAFSVSRINIMVSSFVTLIWFLLAVAQAIGVPYRNIQLLFQPGLDYPIVITATLTTAFLIYLFLCSRRPSAPVEKGKGFTFHRREIDFYGRPDKEILHPADK